MKNPAKTNKSTPEKDKRYQKTEQLLFDAFRKTVVSGVTIPCPTSLTRKAGVSRSTFYQHYKNPLEIYRRHKTRLFHRFNNISAKLVENHADVTTILRRLLIFIYQNQDFFSLDLTKCNCTATIKILDTLKPELTKTWRTADFFGIYAHELIGVLKSWREQNFDDTTLEKTLSELVYLTETAEKRLWNKN